VLKAINAIFIHFMAFYQFLLIYIGFNIFYIKAIKDFTILWVYAMAIKMTIFTDFFGFLPKAVNGRTPLGYVGLVHIVG
jgi:hypothetical protein